METNVADKGEIKEGKVIRNEIESARKHKEVACNEIESAHKQEQVVRTELSEAHVKRGKSHINSGRPTNLDPINESKKTNMS